MVGIGLVELPVLMPQTDIYVPGPQSPASMFCCNVKDIDLTS
jgi:hypothetical protein